jgi:outer membrane protein assembly factor BamB
LASSSTLAPLAAGLMVFALAAGGCASTPTDSGASPGPSAGSPASDSAFPVVHEDWANLGYRLDWVGFPFIGAGPRPQTIAALALDDMLLIQERGSAVTLLEARTGAVRWTTDLAGPLTKFVGMAQDGIDPTRILVFSESEAFTLSAATGALLGRDRFERVANTRPVVLGNVLYFGTSTGEIVAHMQGRPGKFWGFMGVGAIDANPVMVGGAIATVSQSGDITFLTPRGDLLGRARIFSGLATNPVTDGERLFVAGLDQSLWAFDTQGTMLWRFRTPQPLRVQPAVAGGKVFCEIPGSGLTALDATTGEIAFVNANVKGTVIASRQGKLLVWDGRDAVLIDADKGDEIERVSLPGVVRLEVTSFVDPVIYAVSDKGVVARFIPR